MTLDKKYFELKILDLDVALETEGGAHNAVISLFKQIAEDAFAAGAEAQKIADKTAIKTVFELADNGGKMAMLMCAIARIQSATVKWEVPGE